MSISKQAKQQHRTTTTKRKMGHQTGHPNFTNCLKQFLALILLFFLTQLMNCRMSADLPTVPALFVNASLMSVRGIAFVTKLLSKLNCATQPDTK